MRGGATSAALLAALLAVRTASADPADPWWGPDKKEHFSFSAGLATVGYATTSLGTDSRPLCLLGGAGLALGAGLAKEARDLSGRGDPSWRDVTWDVLGTATGLGISLLFDLAVKRLGRP